MIWPLRTPRLMVRNMSSSVGKRSGRRRAALEGARREIARLWIEEVISRIEIGGALGIRGRSAVAVHSVAAGTLVFEHHLAAPGAQFQRLMGRRPMHGRPRFPGSPVADGRADLLHVRLDADHLFRRHRTVIVHVDDAVTMATVGVQRIDIQILEIIGQFADRLEFRLGDAPVVVRVVFLNELRDGPVMRRVLGKQPRVRRHHRFRFHRARIPVMSVVPFVGAPVALAGQVRADAARAEHLRHVVDELARLTHRTPLVGVAVHRADELRMAVPTTLANVDLAAQILDVGSMRRGHGLAFDGGHRLGPGQRLFQIGNESLAGHGQRVETERRNENYRFDAVQVLLLPFLKTTWAPADSPQRRRRAPESPCHAGWSCKDSRIRAPRRCPW